MSVPTQGSAPGPKWAQEPWKPELADRGDHNYYRIHGENGRVLVADMVVGEAHRDLITAAPELYEALDLVAKFMDQVSAHRYDCPFDLEVPPDGAECTCGRFDLVDVIRATLAKARGTSPE